MKRICLLMLVAGVTELPAQGTRAEYERAQSLRDRTGNRVYRDEVNPNWLPDGKRFWYQVKTGPDARETVLVNAETGLREVLKDLSALPPAPALKSSSLPRQAGRTRRTGAACRVTFVNELPEAVELFWLDPDGKARSYGSLAPGAEEEQGTYAGHVWVVRDGSGEDVVSLTAGEGTTRLEIDGPGLRREEGDTSRRNRNRSGVSPDGKVRIVLREHNLFLKKEGQDGLVQLTADGSAGDSYLEDVAWSPDSGEVVATRVAAGQEHTVSMVESSPEDQVEPRLITHPYLKPGDHLPRPRPVLIDVMEQSAKVVDNALFPEFFTESGRLDYRWQPDGGSFTFTYNQRGHQVFRLISVDRASGAARAMVDERSDTFVDYTQKTWHRFLDGTGELLWMSERDGWCHLYLYDAASGTVRNQITSGKWVVRAVEEVDEAKRVIWFMAGGVREGEDPYHLHLCRVNFDGSGFVRLTEGDGTHRIQWSPDRQWFLDSWSRADQPPVTELRRAGDGSLVCGLERADWSALLAEGWSPPERFVAPGRDGVTPIYGTIVRPANFDAAKRYPVLEEVYAGPQGNFAAKEFTTAARQHAFAELGFVVVQADGMGTNHRGKKFHDLCWKNLADAGFADRIAWTKAAAADRPWMDLKRVGIFGGSAGGQNALRALIDHGDFYQAAASDCGCHDNRMDKIWWNEQWMGWPVDESYERSSNVAQAARMQGKVFLTVGELDRNVDPASTMQVVNALVRADKDFDLLVVPGANHGAGEGAYASRRRMDFFVRNLLGVEPRGIP